MLKGWRGYLKSVRRKSKFKKRQAGLNKFFSDVNKLKNITGPGNRKRYRSPFSHPKSLPPKPEYPSVVRYLLSIPKVFSGNGYKKLDDGYFLVPETFSLIDNFSESFEFLKRLLVILQREKAAEVVLDYKNCKRIDVDASLCMDIMLADFIQYYKRCRSLGYSVGTLSIEPKNYEDEHIKRVLFSIGAYRNIVGISINFPDVEALPVLLGNREDPDRDSKCEVHSTKIVEYVKRCLNRLNRSLTAEAEDSLYKVLGETITNAEEHGTSKYRYAIGFFQDKIDSDDHFGIFNFSILNFGETIYQKFKSPECPNKKVVQQMEDLSESYTSAGFFRPATFEEDTLWTLYALQQGVTSLPRRRGSGCIQYIENFFKLKGNLDRDNISQMVLVSGNTRIIFNGSYPILTTIENGRKFKRITFNDSEKISDEPDKKYVTFAPHYFPGVLISARILIKYANTNSE